MKAAALTSPLTRMVSNSVVFSRSKMTGWGVVGQFSLVDVDVAESELEEDVAGAVFHACRRGCWGARSGHFKLGARAWMADNVCKEERVVRLRVNFKNGPSKS